jgi:hypothetical protein
MRTLAARLVKSNAIMLALALALVGGAAHESSAAPRQQRKAAAQRTEAPSKVASIFRGAPGPAEIKAHYANADAIVLYDSLVVTRDDRGVNSKRRHRAVMLLTDSGINRYGDPRILFNSATQKLAVLTSRVYMRDGTIADTQKNGINQTTPFALQAAPDYDDWQETVVTHVGIERGCVAELQYVITDSAPTPWVSGVEVFSAEDPTIERTIIVRVPASITLKHDGFNGAPEPTNPSPGEYVWTVKDVPGRTPYDGGAWEGEYFPTIVYSMAGGWGEVRAGLLREIENAATENEGLKPVADAATKDMHGSEDIILAIHRAAVASVTGVNPAYPLFAAAPRSASRVYASAYGTPLDRAVLLIGLLKAAGFKSVPFLVSLGSAWPAEAAAPEIFEKVVVVVQTDRGSLILDSGAPYEHDPSFALGGRTFVGEGGQRGTAPMPVRPASASTSTLDLVLEPAAPGTLDGEGNAVMTGLFSPYYLLRGKGTQTWDFVQARVKALFGTAELGDWNVKNMAPDRVELSFHFTLKLPDKKSGERVYLAIPRAFEAAQSGIDRVHLERSYCDDAIAVRPSVMQTTCTIEAPAGWKFVALPAPGKAQNQVGSADVDPGSQSGGAVSVHKTLTLEKGPVPPTEYRDLRSLLLQVSDDRLVLERK